MLMEGFVNLSLFDMLFTSLETLSNSLRLYLWPAVCHSHSCAWSLGYDGFGDLMRPATTTEQLTKKETHLFSNDLDTSLASLVGNLNMNGPAMNVKKYVHL